MFRLDRSIEEELSENAFGHAALDVGQTHVATGVTESETLVIETQQVQDCGVPVVNVNFVFDGFVTEVVCRAVADASLHTAASHPGRVARVVVVATVGDLGIRRAAKLAAPEDQRVLQQPAFGKVSVLPMPYSDWVSVDSRLKSITGGSSPCIR